MRKRRTVEVTPPGWRQLVAFVERSRPLQVVLGLCVVSVIARFAEAPVAPAPPQRPLAPDLELSSGPLAGRPFAPELFVADDLQVAVFQRLATSRERVAELLGEPDCGRFYTDASQPGYHGSTSCCYRARSICVVYRHRSKGSPVVGGLWFLNPPIAFDDAALLRYGLADARVVGRSQHALEFEGPSAIPRITIQRTIEDKVREVSFDFAVPLAR